MATQQSTRPEPNPEIDPIWTSSRTARQIYVLGEVEKVHLQDLHYHSQDLHSGLLTLPQTDGPEDGLPQGGERSEQFVIEVGKYFEYVNEIQLSIRSSLAHIRSSRIAPSAINAPPPGFIPPSLGVSLPSSSSGNFATTDNGGRGLQEERVERDAWVGILNALTRLKEVKDRERAQQQEIEALL